MRVIVVAGAGELQQVLRHAAGRAPGEAAVPAWPAERRRHLLCQLRPLLLQPRQRRSRQLSPVQAANEAFSAPGLSPEPAAAPSGALSRLLEGLARVAPALASGELYRRVFVTVAVVVIARLGHFIPLPGLDLARMAAFRGASDFSRFVGGPSEVPGNVFLLSVTPLMSAYFALAVLGVVPAVRRHLAKLREEGRAGREVVTSYITALFLFMAVNEAVAQVGALAQVATSSGGGGGGAGLPFRLQAGVSLVAGATIIKYLTQVVDTHGLGEGAGLLIATGIALSHAQLWVRAAAEIAAAAVPAGPVAAVAGAALSLVWAVVWLQGLELRLPLTFFRPRRAQGAQAAHPVFQRLRAAAARRGGGAAPEAVGVGGGRAGVAQQAYFPLRLSPNGARQLLFANFWVSLLDRPLRLLGLGGLLAGPWAFAALVFALEAVSLADMTPRQMATYLSQSDAGLQGLCPGEETERFLARRRGQLRLLNAALMAALSLAAAGVDAAGAALLGVHPGCLGLLLLVSTATAGARQVGALAKGPAIEALIRRERGVLSAAAPEWQPQQR